MIVGTEEKVKNDKVVKKVIKKLVENNLYIKLEKYKWKVRKVRFLDILIRLESIKMEEENIKGVLNWPIPKKVENI